MDASATEPRRGPGRPRSERAKNAVMEAAADLLLAEGLAAVTMDEVAKRASVSKATIYRWWRSKELLALDALYYEWTSQPVADRDTGSLRGDLLTLMRPWVRRARQQSFGHVVAGLVIEAHTDPDFAKHYQARFIEPRRVPGRAAFARAISRGEVAADTDVEAALDMLFGALYHRLLHRHAVITDRFVAGVVDVTVTGLAPR